MTDVSLVAYDAHISLNMLCLDDWVAVDILGEYHCLC